jgi:hypothetical protein
LNPVNLFSGQTLRNWLHHPGRRKERASSAEAAFIPEQKPAHSAAYS